MTLIICTVMFAASSLPSCALAQDDTIALELVGRSQVVGDTVALPPQDWQWLRDKGALKIGVALPDFAPLEFISGSAFYEGVTADVAGLLGELLHVDVQVVQFSDRNAVLSALESGAVDLVGSANNYELSSRPVKLSRNYIDDQPVLYVRESESRAIAPDLEGLRLAVAEDYLPRAQLTELFPRAEIIPYRSREMALAALAFGMADVYLGDVVSSNYLVNINYFNYVRLHDVIRLPSNGFAFAVEDNNPRLLSILNEGLEVVRQHYLQDILKRWSGGGASAFSTKIDLTPAEQRWVARHPVIRFIVTNDTAPLAYFDSTGRFSGLGADILNVVSQRTGLRFEAVRAEETEDHLSMIEDGRADLTAFPSTVQREEQLRFSRPIAFGTYAIITRNEPGQPTSVSELRGKRIALPSSHPLFDVLQPTADFTFVGVRSLLDALSSVAKGEADATATFLSAAQYYTAALHDGSLKISNIVEGRRSSLAFAMRKGDTELASILNKALLQISPEVSDIFQSRWRPKADVSSVSWLDYRALIYQVGGSVGALIMVSLFWNIYIRSQFRRRQQAEKALTEQLSFMRSLIDETPHPIYVRDRRGRMLMCNSAYLEVLGTVEENVLGKTALEGVKADRDEAMQFHSDYLSVMESGAALMGDRILHLSDGELSVYHWVRPYRGQNGQIMGVICGWIDVSERRRLTEDLQAALELADQSSRAKTTFLATMSHEIRTPLSAVIGMLELAIKHAEQGRLDHSGIQVAHDSARGLLELIGDILDVVRIESGHMSLSPKRTNPRELIESIARVFDGLARQKALSLSLQIDASANCDVLIDPMRFKQIVSNLLGNAIKFTDTGYVRLQLTTLAMADHRLCLQLSVEDTGIGISSDEVTKLFQPFAQANHGHSSRGGTGLGLSISKSLSELMGGTMSVRSSVGKGTCVTLDVPCSVLPELATIATPPTSDAQEQPARLTILVIDDQSANRVLLSQQLAFLGQHVVSAENGEEGLRCWEAGGIDAIITDCNMPVMNGYELTRRIRELEHDLDKPGCIIIGFTANAQPEERVKCLQVGMNDCLFKPINLETLSSLLLSLADSLPIRMDATEAEVMDEAPIDEILYDLTAGDGLMMRAFIAEARNSFSGDLLAWQLQRQQLKPDSLACLAHRIKGAARIFRANRLIDACNEIEQLCSESSIDHKRIHGCMQLVELGLQQILRQVHDFLPPQASI